MKITIKHTTSYSYDVPVNYALQQVRLTPGNSPQQKVLNWSVEVHGGSKELTYLDQYKNHTTLVQADAGKDEIRFVAAGEIETVDTQGVLGKEYGPAPLWHFKKNTERTEVGKGIRALAKIRGKTDNVLSDLHSLSKSILEAVPYGKEQTTYATSAEEAVQKGVGVCQDHAQIFVSAARHADIPARYVSGYLMMNDRISQDASHAWAEAHIDGLGWVGFDVSNGISPDERYVRLATGLDSSDAAPITGMRIGGVSESMIVSLQVQQ